MRVTIEIYKDAKKQWRWRMLRKGRVIGASSEGYARIGRCLKNLHAVTGIEVVRHIDLFKVPVKKEGTTMIFGRIQAPLRFTTLIGERL